MPGGRITSVALNPDPNSNTPPQPFSDEGAPSSCNDTMAALRANLKRAAGETETAGTATFESNRTDVGNVAGVVGK